MELLRTATAFELCGVEPQRSEQVRFNQALVDASGGLLAPVTGAERYLTVSCGHTVQFAKSVSASCRTSQPSLADPSGCLNTQHLCKDDAALKTMVQSGWGWTILPWQAELTWPELPDIAQRALNASNSVASQSSELETAATIAEFAQVQLRSGSEVDWQQCAEAAAATMPPCASYVDALAKLARVHGGGQGAPMVKYLDHFAKAFAGNRRLGEEFVRYLVRIKQSELARYEQAGDKDEFHRREYFSRI